MEAPKKVLISLTLNDAAVATYAEWYPDLQEFQTDEFPPSDTAKWSLTGLTYPLSIHLNESETIDLRVYSIRGQVKNRLRYKVQQSVETFLSVTPSDKPTKRLSPSKQRVANALGIDGEKTEKFLLAVFKLGTEIGGIRLSEIESAVNRHIIESSEPATPENIFERICLGVLDDFTKRAKDAPRSRATSDIPMSPSLKRLATLLGRDEEDTQRFVKQVQSQRREELTSQQILAAVEELKRQNKPLTIACTLEMYKFQLELSKSRQAGPEVKRAVEIKRAKRKSNSVWEIRN